MRLVAMGERTTIWTIGHSTRSAEEFVTLVAGHGVKAIADVRHYPGSRRFPHFNAGEMRRWLPAAGVGYEPFVDLGGRRKARAHSPNVGWRNEAFRGYADYMATQEFAEGLDRLIELARETPTAVMCSEAVPWRCHRSMVADALLVRGWRVLDITSASPAKEHKLTPFAKVDGQSIVYPAEDPSAKQ